MVFGVYDDAIVLLAAGIALEFVNGKHFGKFGGLERNVFEIAHGRRTGNMKLRANLGSGYRLAERGDDLGDQSAGGTIISRKKGVFLIKTLATIAAIAPLAHMQQRCPAKRNILDDLHPIVVYAVCEASTGRAAVLRPRQLKVNMNFLRNIFNICDNYIFQIEQLCGIIFVEHGDSSFQCGRGTFIVKDFISMLNLFQSLKGQAHRLTPTFIIEPRKSRLALKGKPIGLPYDLIIFAAVNGFELHPIC